MVKAVRHRCVKWLSAAVCAMVALAWGGPARADTYLQAVEAAASLLASGDYREAVAAFQQARDLDMNDPLAVAGLGYALDSMGDWTAARGELTLALGLDSRNHAALWANALCALNSGALDEARQRLELLAADTSAMRPPDIDILLAYVRCASGDTQGAMTALQALPDSGSLSPRQRSVAALIGGAAAYAEGNYACAVESLRRAVGDLETATFFDRVQRRRAPILPEARSSHQEPMPLISAPSVGISAKPVSNSVRLYLDPFRIPSAEFARFYIDGKCVQATNSQPLCYDWDTRKWRNGYHKIVIRGEDDRGESVGQEERVLLVHNEGVTFPSPYPEDAYAQAESALRRAMVLQPDLLATHYLLGRALKRLGEDEAAAASLELVMGYDPDYGQARADLQAIYKARNGHRVYALSRVPTGERKIAITFDDGPNPLYTPPLLDLLERYHVRSTMFLVGTQAEQYPDIVREMVEKGHEIANHTYTHANLKTLNRRGIEMELLRNRSVLRRITGKSVELFRPPGGNTDLSVSEVCSRYGLTTVFWDVFDSWLQKYDEATVLTRLIAGIKPGSIILLHNGTNKTARIVEPLLEELTRQGYQMVTVSELLASRTPGVTPPTDAQEAPELHDDPPATPAPALPTATAPVATPGG